KDAGKIAGLEVMRIINEPTAAALAYGLESNANEKILVFDLGGGTFDVSVLEVAEGVVEVEATNGDTHLGGDDWDQAILDWAADKFKQDQGIDLRNDKQALQRLREASEKAKIELSSMQQTEINLPFITADADGPKHMQINLGRSEFEQLTQNLVQKLKGPFESALKDAGVSASDIDQVVLVGGSTRMPMVQDLVEQLTGKSPHKGVNPDEVVAIGAAIQGGVLGGEVKDVLLLDVTPLTLGLETLGEVMTPLIERNTTVPVKKNEVFSTAADNQTAVDIHVLQGERSMAADNMSLGRFRLEGIPAAPRGMPQIEVTFDIDSNGILSVTAQDKATGTKQQITITASTNLDDSEIENMVNAARQNEAEDRKVKELVEARNEADSIAYSAEKALNELGENLDSDERNTIENQIQELREVSQGEDINKIKEISQTLQQASHTLSQQAAANAQENATSNDDSENDKPDDEDVVEGEFTEA
ncbi:MAG TPA: molecular chaperone DnaK, partial [Chloroflexi bacterium]|nr:molecular chaperone DnaK [Chloroflexota bacterium]